MSLQQSRGEASLESASGDIVCVARSHQRNSEGMSCSCLCGQCPCVLSDGLLRKGWSLGSPGPDVGETFGDYKLRVVMWQNAPRVLHDRDDGTIHRKPFQAVGKSRVPGAVSAELVLTHQVMLLMVPMILCWWPLSGKLKKNCLQTFHPKLCINPSAFEPQSSPSRDALTKTLSVA